MWTPLESMRIVHKIVVKNWVFCGWREGVLQCAPVSCLMSLPGVMVKSWAGEVVMKALSVVHGLFVCGVFVCGFFVCGFFVRGFFGANIFGVDFLVRIFRCGFFDADVSCRFFWHGFLVRILVRIVVRIFFGFFFCKETAGRATKKNPAKKSIKKILPQNFLLQQSPPNSSPNPSAYSPVGPHLVSRRCGCTPWCPCGGWL